MKGYIISVMCVSVVASLVSILSPDGDGGGMARNMKLICGICIVTVAVNPIFSLIKEVKNLDIESMVGDDYEKNDYQDKFDSSYAEAELENLRIGIRQMLSDKFGIDMSESSVSLTVSKNGSGEMELERILIILYGSAIFKNTTEIESYIGEIFACETVTAIG